MQHSITFSKLLRRLGVAGCAFALFVMGACTDEAIVYPNRNLKPPTAGATSADAGEGGASPGGGSSAGGGGGLIGGGTGGSPISVGGDDISLDDGGSGGAEPLDQCGDGVVQPPEECDDKNRVSGDGCSAQCKSSCETCEKNVCPIWGANNDIQDRYTACYKLQGNALKGAAAMTSVPRAVLCAAAVDCVRAEHCARIVHNYVDMRSCWCDVDWSNPPGAMSATAACSAEPSDDPAKPSTFVKGKCYQELTDASEAGTSADVEKGFTATATAFGAAYGLLMGCDHYVCAEECFPGATPSDAVARIAEDLTITQTAAGESQLGDLLVDSVRAEAKSDFAVVSSELIAPDGDGLWLKATPNRAADADGRVLRSEALAVINGYADSAPRGAPLYGAGQIEIRTYTGQQVYDVLAEQFGAQAPRLLVSGLKYTWSGVVGQSPNPTIVEVRANDGTLLDKAKNYTLATNSFLTGVHTPIPTLPKGLALTTIPNNDPPAIWLTYLPTLPQPVTAPTLDRVTLQATP